MRCAALRQQQPKDAGAQKPKITDRVGQPSRQPPIRAAAAGQPRTRRAVAAVAQRVVLYEEDPADPQGKRFVGSAIWRTEMVTAGPGAPPDLAVRADIEIPERRITMTFSLRRNTNQVHAGDSHTIEITFNLPADFPVRRHRERAGRADEAGRADARRAARRRSPRRSPRAIS